jgi:hypothetical protein
MISCSVYNWRWRKLKWKDLKTFNVETQAHANVGKVGIKEGIKPNYSHGFRLVELDS